MAPSGEHSHLGPSKVSSIPGIQSIECVDTASGAQSFWVTVAVSAIPLHSSPSTAFLLLQTTANFLLMPDPARHITPRCITIGR